MRRAAPRREPAPYFVGPRCAFVCVCVCLCVYSRVGASCVGRPICMCAVLAPLRRVNTYNPVLPRCKRPLFSAPRNSAPHRAPSCAPQAISTATPWELSPGSTAAPLRHFLPTASDNHTPPACTHSRVRTHSPFCRGSSCGAHRSAPQCSIAPQPSSCPFAAVQQRPQHARSRSVSFAAASQAFTTSPLSQPFAASGHKLTPRLLHAPCTR